MLMRVVQYVVPQGKSLPDANKRVRGTMRNWIPMIRARAQLTEVEQAITMCLLANLGTCVPSW